MRRQSILIWLSKLNALNIFRVASTMNMTDIKAANISSVNRVKYPNNGLKSVNIGINKITPNQILTHA